MRGKTTHHSIGCLGLIGHVEQTASHAWRVVRVATCFVLFGLGCVGLAISAYWLKFTLKNRQTQVLQLRDYTHRLAKHWLQFCVRVGTVRIELDNPRAITNGLIVANHPSLVDVVWILATQPNICCVLKGELENNYLFRALIHNLDYVSNSNPEQLLAEGVKRLRAGEALLVFPEATRTEPGQPPKFHLGAAELAIRSQVEIHPIVIHASDVYLSKHLPLYAIPNRRLDWRLCFCPSLEVVQTADPRHARRHLTQQMQAFFTQALGHSPVAHEPNQPEN